MLLRGPGHESGAKNGPKKQAARWGLETGSKVGWGVGIGKIK